MIDSTRVINALKDCRLSNSLVAEGTGICMLSISRYKRGLATPNGVNLKKLASYFNIPDAKPEQRTVMTVNDYESVIRKKDAQIDQLIALVASITGAQAPSVSRS